MTAGAHGVTAGAHGVTKGAHGMTKGAHGVTKGAHGVTKDAHGVTKDAHGVTKGAHGVTAGAHGVTKGAHPRLQRRSLFPLDSIGDLAYCTCLVLTGGSVRVHILFARGLVRCVVWHFDQGARCRTGRDYRRCFWDHQLIGGTQRGWDSQRRGHDRSVSLQRHQPRHLQ